MPTIVGQALNSESLVENTHISSLENSMGMRQTLTPSRLVTISSANVTSNDFAGFGEVVHNPASHEASITDYKSVQANQGTATKWLNISNLDSHYGLAPSRKPAKSVINMFVCSPRKLLRKNGAEHFPVQILERHPFTPQTFVPLGVSASDPDVRYLVIVAPTLTVRARDTVSSATPPYPTPVPQRRKSLAESLLGGRPNPFTNDFASKTTPASVNGKGQAIKLKGPGEPDLANLRAFVFRGDQAVTYGPGTWHAPMVVLGSRPIDFVVVQHANDVALEDCQEIGISASDGGEGIMVRVDLHAGDEVNASGAGIMRAKL